MSITLIIKITVLTIDKKPATLMDKVMLLEEERWNMLGRLKKRFENESCRFNN